jgi:hypothetical protein
MTNPIIGKTVTGLKIAADRMALLFQFGDCDELIVRVGGDCCSHTWIENVELPVNGFPAKVLVVDDLTLPGWFSWLRKSKYHDDNSDNDHVSYYGCRIKTDRGDIAIDYRNESNGYYGGDLNWDGEGGYYGEGVFDQNVSKLEWQEIT